VPGVVAWTALGALLGSGRFATIFFVTLAVQPPKVAFAFLIPGFVIHTTFGALSGLVSGQLVRTMLAREKRKPAHHVPSDAQANTTPMESEAK
jgi:hypothetical protein